MRFIIMKWLEISELLMIFATVAKSFQYRKMEGFIVGGDVAKLGSYPHSAFLKMSCPSEYSWICGSSILNQNLLLTAAHCIAYCKNVTFTIVVGSEDRYLGIKIAAQNVKIHEEYDPKITGNDIGMILLQEPLRLNRLISRVSLLKEPPMNKVAFIAGWGRIDAMKRTLTGLLMHINQTVLNRKQCSKIVGWIPRGCICGVNPNNDSYAANGDSGSALVVDGYIQIGIVSHKYPTVTKRLIVYTEIAYFYDWIVQTAHELYCGLN